MARQLEDDRISVFVALLASFAVRNPGQCRITDAPVYEAAVGPVGSVDRDRGPSAERSFDVWECDEPARGYVGGAEPVRPSLATERGARTMPSFFIRLRSVLGCRPRIVAAPRGPSMTQADCSRAARMWFRVLESRLSSGGSGPAPAPACRVPSGPEAVSGLALAGRAAVADANTSGSISSVKREPSRGTLGRSPRDFGGFHEMSWDPRRPPCAAG